MRRSFSLAELMIALIILGFGLLIIGAALPVGLTYTQESSDLSVGESAVAYGLDILEQNIRLARGEPVAAGMRYAPERDNLFRPRRTPFIVPPGLGEVDYGYEPLMKVRPLITDNVWVNASPVQRWADNGENLIRKWLIDYAGIATPSRLEVDWQGDFDFTNPPDGHYDTLWHNPALSSVARAYPPITSDARFEQGDFFADPFSLAPVLSSEAGKAMERRISWTAFYRRVAYDHPGPNGIIGDNDDIAGDPDLYEVIVVATRRTAANYYYPRQDHDAMLHSVGANTLVLPGEGQKGRDPERGEEGSFQGSDEPERVSATGGWAGGGNNSVYGGGNAAGGGTISAASASSENLLAPAPWLVVFDPNDPQALPTPPLFSWPPGGFTVDRQIDPSVTDEPPTLVFKCTESVGSLLPVGSIFIPAVNDVRPNLLRPLPLLAQQYAGFVPYGPTSLPIYKVVERPDRFTVIVENIGFYPWVNPNLATPAAYWPVWVIPPSVKERDANGDPIFERKSPILTVARRYVRLREIP